MFVSRLVFLRPLNTDSLYWFTGRMPTAFPSSPPPHSPPFPFALFPASPFASLSSPSARAPCPSGSRGRRGGRNAISCPLRLLDIDHRGDLFPLGGLSPRWSSPSQAHFRLLFRFCILFLPSSIFLFGLSQSLALFSSSFLYLGSSLPLSPPPSCLCSVSLFRFPARRCLSTALGSLPLAGFRVRQSERAAGRSTEPGEATAAGEFRVGRWLHEAGRRRALASHSAPQVEVARRQALDSERIISQYTGLFSLFYLFSFLKSPPFLLQRCVKMAQSFRVAGEGGEDEGEGEEEGKGEEEDE